MHSLNKIVTPKVSSEWEYMAYALKYEISTVKSIRYNHKGDPKRCCQELFEDWLTTSNGVKPKTWKTLLGQLIEVKELVSAAEKIKEELIQMDLQH